MTILSNPILNDEGWHQNCSILRFFKVKKKIKKKVRKTWNIWPQNTINKPRFTHSNRIVLKNSWPVYFLAGLVYIILSCLVLEIWRGQQVWVVCLHTYVGMLIQLFLIQMKQTVEHMFEMFKYPCFLARLLPCFTTTAISHFPHLLWVSES